MTLAQIIMLTLQQSGEDIEDAEEYSDMLRQYINEGYHELARKYAHWYTATLYCDEDGRIDMLIDGLQNIKSISRVEDGEPIEHTIDPDGSIHVQSMKAGMVVVKYQRDTEPLTKDTDIPKLPEHVHGALADYATWRMYGNGNAAKQSRGQFYYGNYYNTLSQLVPQSQRGGKMKFHGLYTCT